MVFIYSNVRFWKNLGKVAKKNFNHKPVAGIQVVDLLLQYCWYTHFEKKYLPFQVCPIFITPPPTKIFFENFFLAIPPPKYVIPYSCKIYHYYKHPLHVYSMVEHLQGTGHQLKVCKYILMMFKKYTNSNILLEYLTFA